MKALILSTLTFTVFLAGCEDARQAEQAVRVLRDVAESATAQQGPAVAGRVSVIDGDTLDLHGQRIRLFGVDAPESAQSCQDANGRSWRCGSAAANRLDEFIGARTVSCRERDTDRYGRTIAQCDVAGTDLGQWMVRNGWALAYTHYSKLYVLDEAAAIHSRAGIHAGSFTPPWEYRNQKRNRS